MELYLHFPICLRGVVLIQRDDFTLPPVSSTLPVVSEWVYLWSAPTQGCVIKPCYGYGSFCWVWISSVHYSYHCYL